MDATVRSAKPPVTALSRRDFAASCLSAGSLLAQPQANPLRLWYREPATHWLEALALGNGRLGAMVFGGIHDDQIVLNDDTLYAEEPGGRDLPIDITKDFDQVTAMIGRGEYAEAEAHMTKHWLGRSWPCYQPIRDIHLSFETAGQPSSYLRELDVSRAVAGVRFALDNIEYEREYFTSHSADLLAIRLKASKKGALSFRLTLESPHPNVTTKRAGTSEIAFAGQVPGIALRRTLEFVEKKGDQWKYPGIWTEDGSRKPHAKQLLYGSEVDGHGIYFEVRVTARTTGGVMTTDKTGLTVEHATEVELLVGVATSFNGFDKSPSRQGANPESRNRATLAKAASRPYSELLETHVADYRKLFDRVELDLGADPAAASLPVPERLRRNASTHDPALAALYFQFGRYLTIAASRP